MRAARTRIISITVAATDNDNPDMLLGPLASYSNFGEPFEIAAPGALWGPLSARLSPGLLCGLTDTANCGGGGTSRAAPAVAGVAALIAAGSPTTFAVPNAPLLKGILLNSHTVVDPVGLRLIPGNRGLTMANLP